MTPESMPALLSARFGIIAALGLLALLSPRLREPQQVLRASLAAGGAPLPIPAPPPPPWRSPAST